MPAAVPYVLLGSVLLFIVPWVQLAPLQVASIWVTVGVVASASYSLERAARSDFALRPAAEVAADLEALCDEGLRWTPADAERWWAERWPDERARDELATAPTRALAIDLEDRGDDTRDLRAKR